MDSHRWYAIQIRSGRENTIQRLLEKKIEQETILNENFNEILQVMVPVKNLIRFSTDGKKTIIKEKILPGYVLVQMKLTDKTIFLINSIEGVVKIVGNKNTPQPITDEEILKLVEDANKKQKLTADDSPFQVGQGVEIINGPFKEFNGNIHSIFPEKGKAKVEVAVFGRPTYVDFEFTHLRAV
jgi:transcription termination/antitermination protein NusG